ncbi:MAG: hypothetical protein J6Y92_03935 [Lentisphaeria bacterium]|nr:hypothetical protein [Lentisphaeria bacterium]
MESIRRLNPLPDPARPLFRPTPAELVLWLVFAAVTLVTVWYHEPWRDEAQAFLVARDNTLPGLVLHMKFESQFLLWYLFTWPFVRLFGLPIFGVNLLHWALSCSTAYLVVRRAPFRFLTRAAMIFGVLFAFEFTVVARHYAAGVFLLAVLLVNWRERFRRPVLYACGIALCASSNLPVWTCLGGLCCTIGYEVIVRRLWSRRIIASMLVCVFGFMLALGSIFNGSGFGSPYVGKRGVVLARKAVSERLWSALDAISGTVYLPVWVCVLCLVLGALYFVRKSIPAFICFLTSAGLMVSLQVVGGFHSMRHVGFLLVGTVAASWIAALDDAPGPEHRMRLPARASACLDIAAGCAAALVLSVQAFVTPFFVLCEILYPFSHGHAAADFIRRNIPEDVPMFCFTARSNVSVLPWLPGRRFFIFDRMEYGTFSKWGRTSGESMKVMADEGAARLEPTQPYGIFVVAMNEDPNLFPPNMILLYDSRKNERPVWGPYVEEFLVFAVVRGEDVEHYRSMGGERRPSRLLPDL